MNRQRQQIHNMTRRTMLIVLIVLQDLLPFIGNLPIGPLSITTLPITVAVVAVVFGPLRWGSGWWCLGSPNLVEGVCLSQQPIGTTDFY